VVTRLTSSGAVPQCSTYQGPRSGTISEIQIESFEVQQYTVMRSTCDAEQHSQFDSYCASMKIFVLIIVAGKDGTLLLEGPVA
jgi:NAD kinase